MKWIVSLLAIGLLTACGGESEVNVADPDLLEPVTVEEGPEEITEPDEKIEDEPMDQATGLFIDGDRYEIREGDTLAGIAIAAGVDLNSLMRWNVIEDANMIWVGTEIVLTGPPVIEYAEAVLNNVVADTKLFFQSQWESDSPLLYWHPEFLRLQNIRTLYLYYLRDGGEPREIEVFSRHIHNNAPLLPGWDEIAKNVFSHLGVDAFEAVPGMPGHFYVINTQTPDLLIGILNARTGHLSKQ